MHDGVNVTPSAPKVRQVLALLALRANSTVPLHQLVEELWEERPPSSAATTLQTYIYQLRKLPGLSLETTPGGYRLSVPQGSLDSMRFTELADLGRTAMEDGRVTEAADLLHRALAVWRGPALSDLTPGPIVGIDALRLAEQCYEVLEERIDADLLLGRHHRLISELTALAADNPTREGLHAKLMLSLYRAGRRPDALEVFQRIRRVLIRELGLEPCSELQWLHQQVLAGDRGLDLPAGRAVGHPAHPPAAPQAPVKLPADVPLIGRDAELAKVGRMLREPAVQGPKCVCVAGAPGVGTTSFTIALAHRLADAFPDGRLYASFGDPAASRTVEDVLGELLEAVGHARAALPAGQPERAALFRAWTAGRRVLLVVDHVSAAHQITDLLPEDTGSAVLVAGYRRLYGGHFGAPVDLLPIGPEQSLELFLGALGRERLLGEGSSRAMLDLFGGLPGPMAEAVGLLELRPHWSVRQLVDWMSRDRPASPTHQRPHPFHHVRRRCGGLDPRVGDALAKLAGEDGEVLTVEQAARVLGLGPDVTEELLEELVEFFLLEVDLVRDGSSERFFQYRMPPLLRMALRTVAVGALA
ncbi:BTAD domain-containing putative transcriptional regulator [Streptomyces sp. NPDC090025]|uniref:AfsR/SARP family transcriptional regulator n=1 Tax=Streptomyces sp. NPDC090025 TaxID=3365922 RepID=UPI003838651A